MILYHYTKLVNFEKIVLKDKLSFRLTEFRNLEDDTEGGDYLRLNIFLKNKNNVGRSNLSRYILSLCKVNDSEYMWHKYGDEGRGIVLALDTNVIGEGILHRLEECDYNNETVIVVHEDIKTIKESYKSKEVISAIQEKASRFGVKPEEMRHALELNSVMNTSQALLRVKSSDYHKEQEMRYIVTPSDLDLFTEGPDQKYKYMFLVDKEAFKAVYLGPKCELTFGVSGRINNYLLTNGYVDVEIQQLKLLYNYE